MGLLLSVAATALAIGYGMGIAKMPFGAPLVMVALGGMTLALCGLALYRVLDPLLRPAAERVESPRAPARLRELERDKQAVLKAIREIELDFQMRKIAESDYKEMVQRYRARAMRIIRELDAGEDYRALIEQELRHRLSAIETAAAGSPCPSCNTLNDKDAVFCKKCGGKLAAEGK